jgi:hypothetical protein
MTARSDLIKAQALSDELDRVTQALAIIATGNFTQRLQVAANGFAGVNVTLSVGASSLTTMLTARQTAIQSALTALGVT